MAAGGDSAVGGFEAARPCFDPDDGKHCAPRVKSRQDRLDDLEMATRKN